MDIEKVLKERQKTHGDFACVADTARKLKRRLAVTSGKRSTVQNEALDLICTKLARIVHGNAFEMDHWKDIAGYATLVVQSMEDGAQEEKDQPDA